MSLDIVTSQKLKQAIPLFSALAGMLLVIAIASILYLGQEIFVPFALALLLSFALTPVVTMLQRMRVPRGLAIFGVLAAFVGIGCLALVLVSQLTSLAGDLPSYRATMQTKLESLASATDGTGPFGRLITTFEDMTSELEQAGQDAGVDTQRGTPVRPLAVTLQERSGGTFAVVTSVVSPLLHPLATVGLVVIFAIFILAQREDLRNRFIRLAGSSDLQKTTAAIDDAVKRLGKLLLTQLLINTVFGLIISLGLWAIGVPTPFLWGIIAGIMRFVPYVGAVVGAIVGAVVGGMVICLYLPMFTIYQNIQSS